MTRPFLYYLLLPLALAGLGSSLALRSAPIVRFVDRHRPEFRNISALLNAERQLFHTYAHRFRTDTVPLVGLVGSSSVVDGIDPLVMDSVWAAAGLPSRAVNLGMTSLTAYELPLIAHELLSGEFTTIVYLYNTFSFGDSVLWEMVTTRWSTTEFWRANDVNEFTLPDFVDFGDAVLAELVPLARYKNLMHNVAWRGITHDLAPLRYPYDYPDTQMVDGPLRRRESEPVAPATMWGRAVFLGSQRDTTTRGFRALRRFVALAERAGVKVIIVPVPEPDFSVFGRYKRGIRESRIDSLVADVADAAGVQWIPRAAFADLEAQDDNFRDRVHMNGPGRRSFSARLAARLDSTLR
ncbi:MAG: hypothetical protein OEW06_16560 [Gemmatimonadota bacterium]|nr:hypothetical protein [Gemmatimonadota bacterium]